VKTIELLEFVSRIHLFKAGIFVADFYSLQQKMPDMRDVQYNSVNIEQGGEISPVALVEKLVDAGYELAEEDVLQKGEYVRRGDSMYVYPVNSEEVIRVDLEFDKIDKILFTSEDSGKGNEIGAFSIFPINYEKTDDDIIKILGKDSIIVDDEVDVMDEYYQPWNEFMEEGKQLLPHGFFHFFQ
jgi:transcription-repair coupling factor (superfamily II helicase)